jgi:small-conductance mechanosensitive channel
MNELDKYTMYVIPAAVVIGGIIAGFIFEKIILAFIKRKLGKTSPHAVITVGSMKGLIILLFVIIGLYVDIEIVTMTPRLHDFLSSVLLVLVIFSVTFVVVRLSTGFIKVYSSKNEGVLPSTSIFVNITSILIYIIGLMVILQTLGISITPILTALGVGGLAVALALQDTLANLFSGLSLIASGKIKTGDYVEVEGGYAGYVVDITWRYTAIRVLPNNIVVIPNKKLAESIVTNYYLPEEQMSVLVDVGVSYGSDLHKVERVTIEVAKDIMKTVKGGIPEHEPFIRYKEFGDSSINFSVILRAKEFTDKFLIKHEFIKSLTDCYRQEGIEIPFPIRTLYLKKEE